ncbi:hypothetical protein CEUSTIGMA_g9467.t1 [Chlamydomonas eustigma]|uniref:t-SNARE coiled-coil homology domain-containing protein n=1 Tax=Chlamydomonas eustigma TaxID=1157962 RepID=A0A250XGK3_9CHLO|nr:hypothetical protein CEUSTIGMA_g9467.t1 [Chlamydomonas eustigma]|eukprot:GAX82039.1 hypothetical protein CEUSTIGMA_g9467.t1 [Chlamydomonas eustigma]
MDRSIEWPAAVEKACSLLLLPPEKVSDVKSELILRPIKRSSQFLSFAVTVGKSISDLSEQINSHKKGYLSSSGYSVKEKDQLEAELGLVIKTCSQQIDRLKDSVQEAQQRVDAQSTQRQLNGQAAAHLHGMVLILAEQLQRVAATFDMLRVQRYQQKLKETQKQSAQYRQQKVPSNSTLTGAKASTSETSSTSAFTGSPSQRQVLIEENKSLASQLTAMNSQVLAVEKSVMEVATLNQIFSSLISSQAQAIETVYENAVEASFHINTGNQYLDKTIRANRSTQYYIFVILGIATFSLLFFDWFYS